VIEGLRIASAYPQSARALTLAADRLFVSTDDRMITVVDLATGETIDQASVLGITDGRIPVDLWALGSLLVASALRWKMSAFQMA
jgi:hypothetical protein